MIFFIQIQIHDRFVTVIKVGTKPRKEMMAKDNKWRISGEIFLASSSPFLPPFFAQIGSLRALAGWRSLISCRDGWLLLLFKDSAWLRERLSKKPFPKFIIDIQNLLFLSRERIDGAYETKITLFMDLDGLMIRTMYFEIQTSVKNNVTKSKS